MTRLDFSRLARELSAQPSVEFALVFGSARDGLLPRPDSDVDIAVWRRSGAAETPEDRLDWMVDMLTICQETLGIEKVDLVILNRADVVTRFEALGGRLLFAKTPSFYAEFFSLTCRYYEDHMILRENAHQYWREIDILRQAVSSSNQRSVDSCRT